MLLNKKISAEQAEVLIVQIKALQTKKEEQEDNLAGPIKQAADLIQENNSQISLLKERIKEAEKSLNTHNKKLELINATRPMLNEASLSGEDHALTGHEKKVLSKLKNKFNNQQAISDIISETEQTSVLTAQQIETLSSELTELSELIKTNMYNEHGALNSAQSSLATIYQKQADNKILFLEQRFMSIDVALKQNADDFARFQLFKQALTPWLELREQILVADKALAELKKIADSAPARKELKIHIASLKQQQDSYGANINAYTKSTSIGYRFASEVDENELCLRVKTQGHVDAIAAHLSASRTSLERQKKELERQIIRTKFGASSDELDRRIQRSPSNDVVLRNFDIEKMLEKASQLATTNDSFNLVQENCSTTSMRILKAGAPADTAALFKLSELNDGERFASNAFLTNPQTIYSVAKTVEMAEKGDLAAQKRILKAKTAKPEREYNRLLNELTKMVVDKSKVTESTTFIPSLLLKFLPHLLKLYRDIFQIAQLPHEEESTSLEAQLARELKNLNGKEYYLIDSTSPALALHRLCEALKENKTNILFLTTDTLSRVEQHILAIQAKVPQAEDDRVLIERYQGLIADRDARIQCIENTILAGESVQENLEKRSPELASLNWTMTGQEKTQALVDNFIYNYEKIRSRNPLSFLTNNFINTLDACSTADMKLREIKKHVLAYPNSRSGQALAECLMQDKVLKTVYVDVPVARKTASFFKMERDDKRQELDSSHVYGM